MNAFELFSESISEPTDAMWAEFDAALNAAKGALTENPAAFALEAYDSEGCPYSKASALGDVLAAMGDVPCDAESVKVQTRILTKFINGEDAWIDGHGHDVIHIVRV